MTVGFVRSSIVLLRTLQVIGAISSVLLGVAIFLQIFIPDASLDPNIKVSDYFVLALLLFVPPLFVLVGSYLQLRLSKLWAVALILVGGVSSLIFVGVNIGFTFLYVQDKRGQLVVLVDLAVIIMTLGLAIINVIVNYNREKQSST